MTTKVLFDVVSMFNEIVLIGIASFLELLMGLSVVLFILDGIKAKSQNRKRKVGITTAFIITIIIHVLACLFIIFFSQSSSWQHREHLGPLRDHNLGVCLILS